MILKQAITNKKSVILILLILSLSVMNISLPILLPIGFSILLVIFLRKSERKLLAILLLALWIRIFFAVGYDAYISTKSLYDHPEKNLVMFGGDGEFQAGHAWWVYVLNLDKDLKSNDLMWKDGFFSDIWTYQELVLKNRFVPMNHYQVGAYSYMIAVLYSYFGYAPIIVNFANCILGILAGYLFYLITLDLFDNKKIAYLVLMLVLFYPTLFIWSSLTKLKMPSIIFLIALFLFSSIRLFLKRRLIYLPLAILPILSLNLFKERFSVIFAFIFLLYYLLLSKKNAPVKLLYILAGSFFVLHIGKIFNYIKAALSYAMLIHQGTVNSGGIVYKLFEDKFYSSIAGAYPLSAFGYFLYYLRGLFHFVFEPLPQSITSKNILLFYPFQIFWYFLLFFALIGILFALRYFRRQALILMIYFIVVTSVLSLSGGNIGTDVRHRDMVAPVCFIFSSIGLAHVLGYKILNSGKNI